MAEVLTIESPKAFGAAVKQAAELLREGEVVALPTETVYGLAANALDADAVSKIFEIKKRPARNPIIVHVSSFSLARTCVASWPQMAEKLGQAFWPGPLTLVLPRAQAIPTIVTAGGETVGVRWPSHPFTLAVIQECQFPLAAPSANPANRLSPTTAEHVSNYFGNRIPLIIDGGRCAVGIESTVLDLSSWPPRVLRQGMIDEVAILSVTGELLGERKGSEKVLKSPGQFSRHYSPRAKLVLGSWRNDEDLLQQVRKHNASSAKTSIISHTRIPSGGQFFRVAVVPHDAQAFGRALYAELHECDQEGVELIVVEEPPESSEWRAIRDRLNRAASLE